MANTFNDLQDLNAMFAQSFSPVNRLGAGGVAVAQNALAQRQQMEEEARRNLFTEQLVARNQQFQVSQAETARRAQMGLQKNSQQYQSERDKLNFAQAQAEANRIFQQRQTGLDMDVARVLKGELEELGGQVPPDASTMEIRSAIQQRLGEGVGELMKQIAPIGKEIMDEGKHDPAKVEKRLQMEIANDPGFQVALKDYPDVLKGLISGSLKLKDVPAELQKPAFYWSRTGNWYDSDADKKNRVNAFLAALIKAQNTVADEETLIALKGPDFKKSPAYLEKLAKYKALNAQAQGLISRLQNPDRIKEAMNFMNAAPASSTPVAGPPMNPSGPNFGLPPVSRGASGEW